MKPAIKYALILLLVVGLALIYFLTPVKTLLTEEGIRTFLDQFGVLAPVAFGVLYFVLTMALIPVTALTILGGLLFGKFWGVIIIVISATLAAATGFIIGRFFGKGLLEKINNKSLKPWITKIDKKVAEDGFTAFFILRCIPHPYIIVSYASGIVKSAKLRDFFFATLLANSIFSFLFVYLGDNLLKGPKALIPPVILIILAFQLPKLIKKFKLDKGLS